LRFGSAGTCYINGSSVKRLFGGSQLSVLTVTEYEA